MNDEVKVYTDAQGEESYFVYEFIKLGAKVIQVSDDCLILHNDDTDTAFALGNFLDIPLLHNTGSVMTDRKDWFTSMYEKGGYSEPLIARTGYLVGNLIPIHDDNNLKIRPATLLDLDFIYDNYHGFSTDKEYIKECIDRGMLIGEVYGKRVGFIGTHEEGSMGLLYILPEYRHNHYAETLENALINKLLDEGHYVWCQVELDNQASIRLQEKLGLTWSKEYYWLFKQ